MPFAAGESRAKPSTDASCRYYHPACVSGGLGPAATVAGLAALSEAQRAEVLAFCDRDGDTREAFFEFKRRRCAAAGHLAGASVEPPQSLPAQDAAAVGYRLQNIAWWDTVDYHRDVREFVPTVAAVPPTLVVAAAEAKRAVLKEAKAMDGY